jgi:hypothetical protein
MFKSSRFPSIRWVGEKRRESCRQKLSRWNFTLVLKRLDSERYRAFSILSRDADGRTIERSVGQRLPRGVQSRNV